MNGESQQQPAPRRWRVRVWFGDHPIADYSAELELAARYAAAMKSRFAGLRITTDPIPVDPRGAAAMNS